ncbi:hypothetical protein D3C80_1019430 [compost metagenome]
MAPQVDLLQQIAAVDHARAFQLDARRRAQQGADDAGRRAADRANVRRRVEAALIGGEVHRTRDARGAIGGDVRVQQAGRALQGPGLGVALEHPGIGGGAGDRPADQAAERGSVDLQADAFGRGAVAGADQAARAGFDVVGDQAPGHALHAVLGPVRRGGEAEAGRAADALDEGLQQVRARKVGIARNPGALVAIAAFDQQGSEAAGAHRHVHDLAVDHGHGREGLVRGIAQRAGDGAALRLMGAQVDAQVLGLVAEGGR